VKLSRTTDFWRPAAGRTLIVGGDDVEHAAMTDANAEQQQVTQTLREVQVGNRAAAERLLPMIYDELRLLAESYFRRERADHTLQPTALVHEAYLRLAKPTGVPWQNKAHFMAVAATAMRRILINHAEARRALKRGSAGNRITLSEGVEADGDDSHAPFDIDLIDLDVALRKLEHLDERQCRVVELRYFGGLSIEQTAQVVGVSERQVKLDWQMARAWLYSQLMG